MALSLTLQIGPASLGASLGCSRALEKNIKIKIHALPSVDGLCEDLGTC